MTIKNAGLIFAGSLSKREKTTAIILHHAAAPRCSVQEVHSWHLSNGWKGIGYHFFVRKDGSIWQGRPIDRLGAHAKDANSYSIGVCFEGDYTREAMPAAQLAAGQELVSYIKSKYPSAAKILKHKDVCATTCPGDNFPFNKIASGKASGASAATGTVKPDNTCNVYAHPTASASRVATMRAGTSYPYTSVYVGGDKVKWYLVRVGNTTGWVSEKALRGCPYTEPKITVYKGCPCGDNVKWAQWHLMRAGYDIGKSGIDGSFGPATDAAVENFQKAKKLEVDRRVGPATRKALKEAVK